MAKEYSDSDWEYTVEADSINYPSYMGAVKPFQNPNDLIMSSFKGLPLPENNVVEILGMEEVEKIDSIIKEMIHWKEILYGKDSIHTGFHSPLIDLKHKTNPNIEISCSSLTDLTYNPELVGEFHSSPEMHDDSLDNYLLRFSLRVKKLLELGEEII